MDIKTFFPSARESGFFACYCNQIHAVSSRHQTVTAQVADTGKEQV